MRTWLRAAVGGGGILAPTAQEYVDQGLAEVFAKGGETGALMRSLDWSATPCGPIASWPSSLRCAVSLCLGSGMPMVFGWGPQYVQFYNDAALPVLSDRHPRAMGRVLREVWPDLIELMSPLSEVVVREGRPIALQDFRLVLTRNRRLESAYYTFSFSPLRNDRGEVVGVLNTFIETTRHVLNERRMHMLRELAVRTTEALSPDEACTRALAALALDRSDLPFALIYVNEPATGRARLAGAFGLPAGTPVALHSLPLGDGGDRTLWPLGRVARTRQPELLNELDRQLAPLIEVGRATPNAAMVLPASANEPGPSAFVVAGLNPYRPLDEDYRGFLQLVAGSIGAAIANARANQEARQRTEQLAELDRLKTAFIGNVSHELRTPLALILGPVDDLLADASVTLPEPQRELLKTVRRNGQRLLRLVDDLLTFARIEAGRVEPFFEPVDLAGMTRELATLFEPAVTRAGLRLVIDCPSLPEPIFVDRDLWEKIVLNLISNALKFTFTGEIVVALRPRGSHVELTVRDTGVGIPAAELPHVFERFYRVRATRARTHDGAGIGLSLLCELARLHGGAVKVDSVEGHGSTFTVIIPRGSTHLAQERIGGTRPAAPLGEQAAALLEGEPTIAPTARSAVPAAPRPRVLVVEDNDDMLAYLERLLGERFDVVSAGGGAAAVALVHEHVPDAVISDVMMPSVDGLALVSLLREDPRARQVPIVLLSARADEEAALEGLSRGADDYVVKPFSSRELLARLGTHLELARMRDELGQLRLKDDFMTVVSHELVTPLTSLKLVFQLARSQLERNGAPEAAMVARVDRALARIESLVNDLLTVWLIKREQLPLATARADLGIICRQAAEDEAAATQRAITIVIPAEPMAVVADADSIGHVVANLLSNAIKFSPAGRPITLTLQPEAHELVVSVRDEGPGIPADELPRLFQRFYRVPGVAIQNGSKIGFGLGLYTCKAIVERHGGRIWVDSTVAKGSTFSFALPRA
jgi:signal transduction histidine kinase